MQNSERYDVVVVGAGPAGAATATHIAAAGHRVAVVDRARFPRDKICGDFVGPVALEELARLGLADAPALRGGNAIGNAGLFVDGEHLMSFALPKVGGLPDFGRVVPRLALDDTILAAARGAGAVVLEGHAFERLRVAPDGADVVVRAEGTERTLACRLIVGADGSSSHVARAMRGRTPPRDDLIVAVRAYFDGVAGPVDRCDVFFGGSSFPGYAWIFPTAPGEANVGVGMVVETFPETSERLRELLARLIREDPGMRARLAGATLREPVVGWPLCTFDEGLAAVDDRVLLVGDAASLVNPLNGEGIQYALNSARWAAETANAALASGDCSRAALAAYSDRIHSELGADIAFARLLVRTIANRSLNPLWLFALRAIVTRASEDPAYARATGGVVAGVVSAREATAPRIAARTAAALAQGCVRAAAGAARDPRRLLDAAALATSVALDVAYDPAGAVAWGRRVAGALRAFTKKRAVPCTTRGVRD